MAGPRRTDQLFYVRLLLLAPRGQPSVQAAYGEQGPRGVLRRPVALLEGARATELHPLLHGLQAAAVRRLRAGGGRAQLCDHQQSRVHQRNEGKFRPSAGSKMRPLQEKGSWKVIGIEMRFPLLSSELRWNDESASKPEARTGQSNVLLVMGRVRTTPLAAKGLSRALRPPPLDSTCHLLGVLCRLKPSLFWVALRLGLSRERRFL